MRLNKEVPGHLVNRIQAALWREAVDAVASGLASLEDVDAAIVALLPETHLAKSELVAADILPPRWDHVSALAAAVGSIAVWSASTITSPRQIASCSVT